MARPNRAAFLNVMVFVSWISSWGDYLGSIQSIRDAVWNALQREIGVCLMTDRYIDVGRLVAKRTGGGGLM